MTSDSSQNGPQGSRPPGRRRPRRFDEGDLWADDADTPAQDDRVQSPPPAQARPRRARPPARQPVEPSTAETAPPTQGGVSQQPLTPGQAPTPVVAGYDDYADEEDYYEEPEPSFLGNPYVLAAGAVVGAILLAVVVVVFFSGGGDNNTPGTALSATRTPTATVDVSGSPASGLAARSIAISTVREGPDLSYLELGTLPSGQDVDIVGRNEDASWLLIVFPAGTNLRGWVPNSALRLPDNVSDVVAVVEPTPIPRPTIPEPTATPPPAKATATGTPGGGNDLAVSIASDCTPGSSLVIAVSNTGTEDIVKAPIEVTVAHDGAVIYKQSFQADIDIGASATLDTGVAAAPPSMSVSVVLTDLDDVNASNNMASCSVAAGGNVPPALQATP